jgi:signal transduction histidine kinase
VARILHIEDDPANRLLVRKLLIAEGHQVIDAIDGLEGVRLALSERPELVLVDLNLPGLDGYEVTLRLRAEASLKGLPIVAITAEGDRDTSLSVGCNGFLQKPIDARNFSKQVSTYLAGRRERMQSTVEEAEDRLRVQGGRVVARLEQKVAELSRANARLIDGEKRRTEFYRNMSHELATPLTPIVGYAKMLHDEELGALLPGQKKALRAMNESLGRLRETLGNLVDVVALEAGKMQFAQKKYDFRELLLRVMAARAEAFAKKGITLLEDLPEGEYPALGDDVRVARAMAHLVDNACKFNQTGSIVGVATCRRPEGYVLTVADNGAGLPEAMRAQAFEAFVQIDGSTTRAQGGVGVGLAIAQKIARGHGGDVVLVAEAEIEGMHLAGAVFELSVHPNGPQAAKPAANKAP